jgi:site-specific recombinase XerD
MHRNVAASLPEYLCHPAPEVQPLSVDECFDILESFDTKAPLDLRNYIIVAMLWSTGLRNSELCALRWGDIDLNDAHLMVREGKGGKQRQVFLNDRLCDDLRAYRQQLCPNDGPAEPVFFAFTVNAPQAEEFKPLSTRQVNAVVRDQARKVGITKRVNPLVFRHTFATHMLEAGVDIDDIKEIMGHDDATETTVYLHVTMDTAKRFLNDHVANPWKYR